MIGALDFTEAFVPSSGENGGTSAQLNIRMFV